MLTGISDQAGGQCLVYRQPRVHPP